MKGWSPVRLSPARVADVAQPGREDPCLPFVDFRASRATYSQHHDEGEIAMQYLLLIYEAEADWNALPAGEVQKIYGQYMTLVEDLKKNGGKYVGGNQLQPIATAKTVRIRNGKKTVTDGPFAETKEQLGGYFLVEARDLDEAMAIAARIPGAQLGSIEVRPVVMR
jgi:hypothetical protein